MFCKKCGAKNDDDAVFCVSCGTKIGEVQAEVNNSSEEIAQENDEVVKENDNQNSGDNLSDNLSDSFFQQADNNVEDEKNENVEEVNQEETKNTEDTEDTIEPVEISKTQDNYDNVQNNQIDNQPDNSFARSQFENDNQLSNGVQKQTEKANKFSFKRFLFSAIVLIATILSCATLFMNYLSMEVKVKDTGSGKESITGIDIIKSGIDDDIAWDNDYLYVVDDDEERIINKTKDYYPTFGFEGFYKSYLESTDDHKSIDVPKTIRYCTIGLGVALVVFAVIEFILLVVVRRRGAYVLIMLFSLIKLGLGGYIGYLWCFKLLNMIKDMFNVYNDVLVVLEYKCILTAGFGIGFILMMVAQLVTFICSIILMTCKNRKKVKYN